MREVWMPLKGAIDLHIHIADRYYDSISLAREASRKRKRNGGFSIKRPDVSRGL